MLNRVLTATFQNFLLKLKGHLLPRLKVALAQDAASVDSQSDSLHSEANTTGNMNQSDCDSVYLKNDRIYLHKLVCIQYTTYDI